MLTAFVRTSVLCHVTLKKCLLYVGLMLASVSSLSTLHYVRSYTGLLSTPFSYFPSCWSLLNTSCIYGSPSTLFLSGSQQSGRTSSQFSTCVTPYINTEPHVRRHSCRRPRTACQHTLLHSVCVCVGTPSVCGVKGAIHEQLAGVKSGQSWAAVYDF